MKRYGDQELVVKIKRSSYQPSNVVVEEEIKLDIPGETPEPRAENLAKAILRPVKVEYEE